MQNMKQNLNGLYFKEVQIFQLLEGLNTAQVTVVFSLFDFGPCFQLYPKALIMASMILH